MKLTSTFSAILLATSYVSGHVLPEDHVQDLASRDARNVWHSEYIDLDGLQALEKRKGGGGKGGGSSSSSGSSGSSSSSGGSSSSGSSSGGRSGTSGSSGSSGSSSGGGVSYRGTPPAYNGAYRGGAVRPFGAGSPSRGITPFLLPIAALAFIPGVFLAGAYLYNFPDRYTYYNQSSNANETAPIDCYCTQGQQCGCEPSDDEGYVNSVVGNGSYAYMQDNGLYKAANGTLYINGTLDNDVAVVDDTSAAAGRQGMIEAAGWWVTVAVVGATVWTGMA